MSARQTPTPASPPRGGEAKGPLGVAVTTLTVVAGRRLLGILLGAAALWLLLWTVLLMSLLGVALRWIAAPG